MIFKLGMRMLLEPDRRCLFKFAYNFGWKGMRAVNRFKKRVTRERFAPAFLFMSVTNRCNLTCQGCWVSQSNPPTELSLETMDRIVRESKSRGNSFFGILGGEPLLHRGLFELFAKHPDCYFQLFTNGMLITDDVAARMRRLGNITPLISIEGLEAVSDERRGGKAVYERTLQGLDNCIKHRLITGVATSVCQSNIDDLVSPAFVNSLIDRKVHYLWYYVYRPVGPNPSPELTLTEEQIVRLRQFIVDTRCESPIALVDAYWDHDGKALCPAAVGIGYHISPAGCVEPCPIVQCARDNVGTGEGACEMIENSAFLAEFRTLVRETTQGCILLERPDLLRQFMIDTDAIDSSGRGSFLRELAVMGPQTCHHLPGREIPEKSWVYRFAKKYWFFGFGAYG